MRLDNNIIWWIWLWNYFIVWIVFKVILIIDFLVLIWFIFLWNIIDLGRDYWIFVVFVSDMGIFDIQVELNVFWLDKWWYIRYFDDLIVIGIHRFNCNELNGMGRADVLVGNILVWYRIYHDIIFIGSYNMLIWLIVK